MGEFPNERHNKQIKRRVRNAALVILSHDSRTKKVRLTITGSEVVTLFGSHEPLDAGEKVFLRHPIESDIALFIIVASACNGRNFSSGRRFWRVGSFRLVNLDVLL